MLLTTDHGSIHCHTPATVFAKRDATQNLRYKFGEYEDKWWPSTGLDTIAEPAPLTALV